MKIEFGVDNIRVSPPAEFKASLERKEIKRKEIDTVKMSKQLDAVERRRANTMRGLRPRRPQDLSRTFDSRGWGLPGLFEEKDETKKRLTTATSGFESDSSISSGDTISTELIEDIKEPVKRLPPVMEYVYRVEMTKGEKV